MEAAETIDPRSLAWRAAAQDRYAGGDERDLLSASHWLPLALPAARRISAALDGLQYLPQVSEGRRVGGHLGTAAHDFARATRARGKPHGGRHRQPDAEGGGKGGGFDGEAGYDAGKKVKGRKIYALADTEGLPLRAVVHSAGIQDRDGAALVLDKIRNRFPWLELVWADNGTNAWQVKAAVAKVPVLRLEIVKRGDGIKGFAVLPRRWVVERTFSWSGRNRRLAKDYENPGLISAAFVTLACIQIAVRRLAR